MSKDTLDGMGVKELRDLATRATNAAEVQEKEAQAAAEKQRLADEAKKKAEVVFEHGEYALLKDGTLRYKGYLTSCFEDVTVKALLGRIRFAGGGYDKVISFLAAYDAYERGKPEKASAAVSDSGFNAWMNNLYGSQNYSYQNMYSFGNTIR